MGSPKKDFDLLLEAPEPVEAQMAQNVLEQAGIPSMLHGVDRYFIELGYGTHFSTARPSLFVPRGARERALAVLRETWDADALTDEMALAAAPAPAPIEASLRWSGSTWRWMIIAVLVLIVVLTYAADFFAVRH